MYKSQLRNIHSYDYGFVVQGHIYLIKSEET